MTQIIIEKEWDHLREKVREENKDSKYSFVS